VTDAAAPTDCTHVHEAGFFRSDAEFGRLIVDFVDSAVAAGEPVIIGFDRRKNDLVRSSIADDTGVTFVGDSDHYGAPARAIGSYQRQFEKHMSQGATRVRIAGEIPNPGNGGSFTGWDRYESGINTLWRDLPVWSRCLYDATALPQDVHDVVVRAHPRLVGPDGRATRNAGYEGPEQFTLLPVPPDPLEAAAPAERLVGCSPGTARNAIQELGRGHVDPAALDDLVYAASEAVTNAHQYGRPPVTVRIWRAAHRMLVTVHDTGAGPGDRSVGFAPRARTDTGAGLGLWIAHHLDVTTDLIWDEDGFTVRLAV
jgi:anti-sigma regulatory factor (Ser/Thr protein kinase)